MSKLLEDRRNELVAKSKNVKKEKDGKTRYQKRVKSRVSSSNKTYNRINMNELFKKNILTIGIEVHGETDNYIVRVSFGGFLDTLFDELRKNKDAELDLRDVVRAIVRAFNQNDVYVNCNCPDAQYRMNYWQTVNKISSGEPELRPSKETNPDNDLGTGCKHVMLVLANTSWIIKVASVILNYINYMKKNMKSMYARSIYPAIYRKKYEEPVQTSMFDDEDIVSDEETIDKSNKEAREKGQFKSGNPYRYEKQPNKDQISIEDEENIEGEDNQGEE